MDAPLDIIAGREKSIQRQIIEWQKLMLSENGAKAMFDSNLIHEQVLEPFFEKLRNLYLRDLPLIKLQETSDVILHVEGRDIHGENPQLKAVNWLGKTVRAQFNRLAAAALPGVEKSSIAASKDAQWEITGLIPGSIYMGFALHRQLTVDAFVKGNQEITNLIVNATRSIALVPQFVSTLGVNEELTEAITDPSVRDAAMMAAMQFAPTKSGQFDSVEIFSPGAASGILHYRERLALRHALMKPMMRKKQDGVFVGELNEIDLDSSRFQLRNVSGVGTLRCVMDFTPAHARRWLGHKVRVSGLYDSDSHGRPRLIRVTQIDVIEKQGDIENAF
jgi:hypothetical protein